MTESQKKKCHAIIHTGALAAGAGNCFPIPGTGLAADTVALTTMACSLAAVFGRDPSKAAAKGIALAAIKKQLLKSPIKALVKEVSKIFVWGGPAVSATISVAMVEAAGWAIADEFDRQTMTSRY